MEDMSTFGIKFEGWRKAAQKAGRSFRRVEEGAEPFMGNSGNVMMRRRDEEELQSDTQRPRQRHPPSASLSGRREGGWRGGGEEGRGNGGGGGGGRGGVMPKRLRSGSGHHRLEGCGPWNGRHKLA